MDKLYTCKEIARRYGVNDATVCDWVKKKKVTALKIGREYRFREKDLEAFEAERETRT